MLPAQAGIGNMYRNDRIKLSGNLSTLFTAVQACAVICPILGGYLTSISLMLPFAAGACPL